MAAKAMLSCALYTDTIRFCGRCATRYRRRTVSRFWRAHFLSRRGAKTAASPLPDSGSGNPPGLYGWAVGAGVGADGADSWR